MTARLAPNRRPTHLVLAALVAALAILIVPVLPPIHRGATARAAAPASATIAPGGGPITWTGAGSDPEVQQAESACTATSCDTFALTASGTPADWTGSDLLINIRWALRSNDFDLYVHKGPKGDRSDPVVAQSAGNSVDTFEQVRIYPTETGVGLYTISVVPYSYLPGSELYTGTIASTRAPAPSAAAPRYQVYPSPAGLGDDAGEPSIGSDWKTGATLYQAGTQTLRVGFDDCSSPARATWKDASPLEIASLDPIGLVDSVPGRTFSCQLLGKAAHTYYSDDDGEHWTLTQGNGVNSGVDHQSLGAGPYHAIGGQPFTNPVYPHAVYYCSQDSADASCARSDDGGLTYGAAAPIYTAADCDGLHGHVKVSADGTAYVPNRSCGGSSGVLSAHTAQGVAVSEDDGTTWRVRVVPTATSGSWDPSVGTDKSNNVYFGYVDGTGHARAAMSPDHGQTWSRDTDVGAAFGIKNTAFPAVVAGDAGRAAYAFLGSTVAGDSSGGKGADGQPNLFAGDWHLYVATTLDGGTTWTTVDATPGDPVQRGAICSKGTVDCSSAPNDRNLLDFMDATVDRDGRVLVGFADGCVDACVTGGANSATAKATIVRQSGGRRLFAANDPVVPAVPAAPAVTATRTVVGAVKLSWPQPDDSGSPITGYRIARGASPTGPFTVIGTTTSRSYIDATAAQGTAYAYRVTAVNAVGEGPGCPIAVSADVVAGSPCVLPGVTILTDPVGDNEDQMPNHDLTGVYGAEPFLGTGVKKLFLTMKVQSLDTLTPRTTWRTYFQAPNAQWYYLDMRTDAAGAPTFMFGTATFGPDSTGNSTFTSKDVGPADPLSGYTKDGMIRLVVADDAIGAPAPGTRITSVASRIITGIIVTENANYPNPSPAIGYTVVGNSACTTGTLGGAAGRQPGYRLVASDGGVFAFGSSSFAGSTGAIRLVSPMTSMATTPGGEGYWLAAADGGVFAFGDAPFVGSLGAARPATSVVAITSTASGRGYWLVTAAGEVFPFGNAKLLGSLRGVRLNKPIVGMAATASGAGYWLVASDGGVFAFGDARYAGSTGGVRLNSPVVGMTATDTGAGYWLVAADGGVFSFGDARFLGSAGGIRLNKPVNGIIRAESGNGYWLVASDGGVFSFGDAPFLGSTGGIRLNKPMVGGNQ